MKIYYICISSLLLSSCITPTDIESPNSDFETNFDGDSGGGRKAVILTSSSYQSRKNLFQMTDSSETSGIRCFIIDYLYDIQGNGKIASAVVERIHTASQGDSSYAEGYREGYAFALFRGGLPIQVMEFEETDTFRKRYVEGWNEGCLQALQDFEDLRESAEKRCANEDFGCDR